MSYYRYKRLQQYINGQPTDVYKKGERVDDVDYSTYEACMGSSADTRWVSIPQTVCYDGDLWSMEKEQISYDGISWTDTGNSRRASVIEQSSAQCFMNDWRVVPGEFICMMHAKWTKEAEYVSYDGGQTWTATGNIRRGETVIELLSADCGVIYQWIPTGEYICQGYNKYMKEKQVYSTDNGSTWTDTGNRRTGGLVEADSPYCGYEQYIYQWVDVAGEYVCQGTTKYKKQKEQRSSDNGQTWEDTGNTRQGEVIEVNSFDCGYVAYRWVSDTGYVCVGFDKYNKEKEQSTTDGTNWTDTGNTRAGSTLIESLSTDCGVTYRWVADTGYVCVGYDKYSKEKEQYSTDGSSWTDTGNTRAGSTLIEHNSEDCGYDPSHDYSTDYLTTEALGNGNIGLGSVSIDNKIPLVNIQYSKNDGAWTSYTYNTIISVATGDKIRWKATLNDGNSIRYYSSFGATADYKAYGNPLSLLNNDNFVNEPDAIYRYAYYGLFANNSKLKDISGLALPATTLASWCYCEMFYGCTSLTSIPSNFLPARTLAEYCYKQMFDGCTSLNSVTCCATNKSAYDCTYLWLRGVSSTGTLHKDAKTTWPTGMSGIPEGWTTDTCGCGPDYSREYLTTEALESGNISLNREVSEDYQDMYPLTNIQYSKNDGSWTPYTYDTQIPVVTGDKIKWKAQWNDGVSFFMYRNTFKSTVNYKVYGNPLSLLKNDNFSGVTNLSSYYGAFGGLFLGEEKLTDVSDISLPATTLSDDCYAGMFQGCKLITSAPELPATIVVYECYMQMFADCTSLTDAPVLHATKLAKGSYYSMFLGCTSLSHVECYATSIRAYNCTKGWLENVSTTGTFTKKTGTYWPSGDSGIPSGWTVVEASKL